MNDTGSAKLRAVKGILWFVLGFAAVVAVVRFLAGLGAVTDLTDRTPWGLWVGFDARGDANRAENKLQVVGLTPGEQGFQDPVRSAHASLIGSRVCSR